MSLAGYWQLKTSAFSVRLRNTCIRRKPINRPLNGQMKNSAYSNCSAGTNNLSTSSQRLAVRILLVQLERSRINAELRRYLFVFIGFLFA